MNVRETPLIETQEQNLQRLEEALDSTWQNPLTEGKLIGCSISGMIPVVTGSAITCVGRYTIRLQMAFEKVALKFEDSVNDLGTAIESLSGEMQQIRIFSLQNRLAVNYLLASQGGVCAIGSQCCIYTNDSSYEIYQKLIEDETHACKGAQSAYNLP